jgi:hypothetical protein
MPASMMLADWSRAARRGIPSNPSVQEPALKVADSVLQTSDMGQSRCKHALVLLENIFGQGFVR